MTRVHLAREQATKQRHTNDQFTAINVHGSDEEDEKRERERDYSVFRIISRWSDEMEIMRERI